MRWLFALLLFAINASGQDTVSSNDSSVVRIIEDLPPQGPFDTGHNYRKVDQQYVYILSDNNVYRIFGYETAVKYHDFNFTDHHILGHQINGKWTWQVRENKKAFVEIPSTAKRGWLELKLANGRTGYFEDTLMRLVNDSAKWYTQGHGDCFARFEYALVRDKYHPVVILKERNYWGGCRAGGTKAYTISFAIPRNVLQFSKTTILMDKYRDQPED